MIELDYDGPLARIAMKWPEALKDMVRDVAGPRGLTEFTIEAVCEKLESVATAEAAAPAPEVEMAEDGSASQNIEAPEDLGTQTREQLVEAALDPELIQAEKEQREKESAELQTFDADPEAMDFLEKKAMAKDGNRDDLFARIMAKTGGALDDVPGLKLASDIEKPAPKPVEPEPAPQVEAPAASTEVCPNCGDLLVEGECWSCA